MSDPRPGPPFLGWQPIASAPRDGTTILLHFPGEIPDVRGGRYVKHETYENGTLTFSQEGWAMTDRAEIRPPEDPENWCPVQPPPSQRRTEDASLK